MRKSRGFNERIKNGTDFQKLQERKLKAPKGPGVIFQGWKRYQEAEEEE